IRPEIAQTAVQLGVDFTNIKIKANLAQALNYDK
ncbi:RsbT co-antagonist protein RsbRB, partial [Bacillus atrophaeus]|nr:RsbT co-antagonist protein RsbRB [Bacillus atrophaeus]